VPGFLFDTSVRVALSFGSHPHFRLAEAAFLAAAASAPAVFCRAMQQSFLRHLSSPKMQAIYKAPPTTNTDAWRLWEELSRLPQVRFADEPPGIVDLWRDVGRRESASPKVWMDAWLAASGLSE
jgi:predicted nucleic acid-binding protein